MCKHIVKKTVKTEFDCSRNFLDMTFESESRILDQFEFLATANYIGICNFIVLFGKDHTGSHFKI